VILGGDKLLSNRHDAEEDSKGSPTKNDQVVQDEKGK